MERCGWEEAGRLRSFLYRGLSLAPPHPANLASVHPARPGDPHTTHHCQCSLTYYY